jgi:2-polyprenyl-3-methyl-5-hydroxy-6-metoxy-1,4-benzoquinol methylase
MLISAIKQILRPIKRSIRCYFMNRIKKQDFRTLERLNSEKKECYKVKNKAKKYPPFFVQEIILFDIFDRMNLFEHYCKGKKVLHIGCVDYPIFNPENNLHISLSKLAAEIHGHDLNAEGLKTLKQYVDQPYFSSLSDVTDSYDICLIPEVIEHVDNISLFLKEVDKINANIFIISGPNAFGKFYRNLNFFKSGQLSAEIEHPDHNCYFSPYTLKNVIQKYSCLKVQSIFLTYNQKSVTCICKKVLKDINQNSNNKEEI